MINTKANTWGLLVLDNFNSLVLLHPDEKDKELKQDLVIRPNEGNQKPQIIRPKEGNEKPKLGSEIPKDEPEKDKQP
jgi:hypothetical protein